MPGAVRSDNRIELHAELALASTRTSRSDRRHSSFDYRARRNYFAAAHVDGRHDGRLKTIADSRPVGVERLIHSQSEILIARQCVSREDRPYQGGISSAVL